MGVLDGWLLQLDFVSPVHWYIPAYAGPRNLTNTQEVHNDTNLPYFFSEKDAEIGNWHLPVREIPSPNYARTENFDRPVAKCVRV